MVWQSIWIGVLKLKIDTNKCNAHIFIDFKQQLHSFTTIWFVSCVESTYTFHSPHASSNSLARFVWHSSRKNIYKNEH